MISLALVVFLSFIFGIGIGSLIGFRDARRAVAEERKNCRALIARQNEVLLDATQTATTTANMNIELLSERENLYAKIIKLEGEKNGYEQGSDPGC